MSGSEILFAPNHHHLLCSSTYERDHLQNSGHFWNDTCYMCVCFCLGFEESKANVSNGGLDRRPLTKTNQGFTLTLYNKVVVLMLTIGFTNMK